MAEVQSAPHPAVPYLDLDAPDGPCLRGTRCTACGAVQPGVRNACGSCGAREGLQPLRLAERGTVHTFTIVHRSFPGVKTPFVAVVVDLDGGGTIKGTLLDVQPDPAAIPFGMPVKVIYRDTGQRHADGGAFVSYFFVPARGEPA